MRNHFIFMVGILIFAKGVIIAQDTFQCGDAITDDRDQKKYQTVLIGNQCWMAENLNIGKQVTNLNQENNQAIEKTCQENRPENCDIYGGLYTWNEAMNWNTNPQGICPEGWHIPSKDEWQQLSNTLGKTRAGTKMKATNKNTPAWDGTNESGFNALPGGNAVPLDLTNGNGFGRLHQWALFWSSTEANDDYSWFSLLDGYWNENPPRYHILYIGDYYLKLNGFSVRCIKD